MPSLLFNKVGQFFSSVNPNSGFNACAYKFPAAEEEEAARLNVGISAKEDELYKTRQELEDEKARSRKWERRAVVARADLAAAKSGIDDIHRLQKRLEAIEDEKLELEHRMNRLNRMLTVAEEQRDVAITRLEGFTGDIEGAQEENRILKRTVTTLRHEVDSVTDCWRADVEEMEITRREWEIRENSYLKGVVLLEGKLDDVSTEKRIIEDKLSNAQSQLLDADADRCLVNILGAEKERLMERIEKLSQTAKKVVGLEDDIEQLHAQARESKRKLESVSKLIVALKMKNERLFVDARERQQYGESMAQMFADMKKECERVRRERDENARQFKRLAETHDMFRLQQEEAIEALQTQLGTKTMEASVYQTNLKEIHLESEFKDRKIQTYFNSYARIVNLVKLNVSLEGVQPDFETLESSLSNAIDRMQGSEAEVSVLQKELTSLRQENQCNLENAKKLIVELARAERVQTEIKEVLDVIKDENVRLCGRGTDLEGEVSNLTKTNKAVEKRMEELVVENENLERKIAQQTTVSRTLQDERDVLLAEMESMQASMAAEREEIASNLAKRFASLASLENELKDARETYRTAAKKFESQRLSVIRRLTASDWKEVSEQGLVQRECFVNHNIAQTDELARKCQQLEEENDGLKEFASILVLDDNGDFIVLREMLAEPESKREALAALVNQLQRTRGERRLSSSSVSSDDLDMKRRVQELDTTIEEEAKEEEAQKQQLCDGEQNRELLKKHVSGLEERAKEKELEVEKLHGEMVSIYSGMKKSANVSIPPGAEELLEEADDLRRLNEIRAATKKEEKSTRAEREKRIGVREYRKLPAQKRKFRIGALENKMRFRMREEHVPTSIT